MKVYNRDKARIQRRRWASKQYAKKRATAQRCPWGVGRNACGGLLEITVDRLGKTHTRCRRCERREARICQDCPNPIDNDHLLSLRCPACKYQAKLAAQRRFYYRHAEDKRESWASWQRNYRARHPELLEKLRIDARRKRLERKRRILRGVVA